jgi:hypothetical protein
MSSKLDCAAQEDTYENYLYQMEHKHGSRFYTAIAEILFEEQRDNLKRVFENYNRDKLYRYITLHAVTLFNLFADVIWMHTGSPPSTEGDSNYSSLRSNIQEDYLRDAVCGTRYVESYEITPDNYKETQLKIKKGMRGLYNVFLDGEPSTEYTWNEFSKLLETFLKTFTANSFLNSYNVRSDVGPEGPAVVVNILREAISSFDPTFRCATLFG